MLLLLILPILFILVFMHLRRVRIKKKISFVGPRGSGKTRTIFKICKDLDVKTVPTVEDYELPYRHTSIREQVPKDVEDPYLKYGILEKNTVYFFFINSLLDVYEFNGFEVKFVYFGQERDLVNSSSEKSKIIFINRNPDNIISFVDESLHISTDKYKARFLLSGLWNEK